MIIAEIGLNHLGKKDLLCTYVNELIKSDVDAITFQIREHSFYKNSKWSRFKIDDILYVDLAKKIKNSSKKIGVALSDLNKISLFESINVDFYKILSKDLEDLNFLQTFSSNTNKKIYLSTGMSNYKNIDKALKYFDNCGLIHTRLSNNPSDVNLKAMEFMKKRYGQDISFGNHCENLNVIYAASVFLPSNYFVYVKLNNKHDKYPDCNHAVKLSEINFLKKNIKEIEAAVGGIEKKSSSNIIGGQI